MTNDVNVIRMKIGLAKTLEGMLDKDPDPRAPEVKAEIQRQRGELEAMLSALENGDPVEVGEQKPKGQVVQVKALTLESSCSLSTDRR